MDEIEYYEELCEVVVVCIGVKLLIYVDDVVDYLYYYCLMYFMYDVKYMKYKILYDFFFSSVFKASDSYDDDDDDVDEDMCDVYGYGWKKYDESVDFEVFVEL